MLKKFAFAIATVAVLSTVGPLAVPAHADSSDGQLLVDQAKLTAQNLLNDKDMPDLRYWMKRAKAVLIVPSLLKAGFLVGAEGGSGVLLTRDAKGVWSYPAFYTLGAGSFGLQIGLKSSETIFLIMSDGGLQALLENPVKLGADVSMAVGPVGGGVSGATTTNLRSDVYSFSKSKGLFGGISFDGAVAVPRNDMNEAFYGKPANSKEIVLQRMFANKSADSLRRSLRSE